jgi:hypothetical protein
MFSEGLIQGFVDGLVLFATDSLLPCMGIIFVSGIFLRTLIFYTVKREDWFAREFEKRVHAFVDNDNDKEGHSFFMLVKKLLEKTYYESFEVRAIMKRRKPDYVMSLGDRLFLVQHGSAWLVKDALKHIKYLKHSNHRPKLLEISKSVFQNNPCFNRVFGIIPGSKFNDILNILPGMFIIGGIFGTFLGIMKALPELGGMDLTNVEQTKMVMDGFLLKISFSMSTSIIGIVLSVAMSIFNTVLSPEKLFIDIVERFETNLDHLWNVSSSNSIPKTMGPFDEHADPIEALAAESLNKELSTKHFGIPMNNRVLEDGPMLDNRESVEKKAS